MQKQHIDNAELEAGEKFLREYLAKSGKDRYVLGLSGGIDSAVVALWCARAVGVERLVLVSMPYGANSHEGFHHSSEDSISDAQKIAAQLAGVAYTCVDIKETVDQLLWQLDAASVKMGLDGGDDAKVTTSGNTMARVRAVTLRGLANLHNGLVLGTENRTENLLGYFTIGGDEESDIELLSPYLKSEVRELAKLLGVPQSIQDKAPSADLRPGHTDEGELGFSYTDADRVLAVMEDCWHGAEAIDGVDKAAAERVIARVRATDFKRAAKPCFTRFV